MSVNGVTNVSITREMVLAAQSAMAKYTNFLAHKTEPEQAKKLDLKRKAETGAVNELQKLKQLTKNGHIRFISSSPKFKGIL